MHKRKSLLLLWTGALWGLASCAGPTSSTSSSIAQSTSKTSDTATDSASVSSTADGSTSESTSQAETHAIVVQVPEHCSYELSATEAKEGETLTLTIAPEEGWTVVSVTLNGEEVDVVENVVTFTMPDKDVTMVVTLSEGYPVTIENVGSIEGYLVDATSVVAPGEEVLLGYRNVGENFFFTGFTAKSEEGEITIKRDEELQCSFRMPESPVTVTCTAMEIPEDLSGIVQEFAVGLQLNTSDSTEVRLQIRPDRTLTLSLTGLVRPVMEGTYAVQDPTHLTATLEEGTLEIDLSEEKLAKVFFDWDGKRDVLLLGTDENVLSKRGSAYSTPSGEKIYPLTVLGENVFSYCSEEGEIAYYDLKAFDDATGTTVDNFVPGGIYSLREEEKEIVALQYLDGTSVSLTGEERGTYTLESGEDLVLDGFGTVRYGERKGRYVYTADQKLVTATFGEEEILFIIDTEEKTYSVFDPSSGDASFAGKTYQGEFSVLQDDGWTQVQYFLTLTFAQEEGKVSYFGATPDPDDWNSWNATAYEFEDLTYTFDSGTNILTVEILTTYGSSYPTRLEVNESRQSMTMLDGFYFLDDASGTVLNITE